MARSSAVVGQASGHPEMARMRRIMAKREQARGPADGGWHPAWRVLASAAIVFHVVAVLAVALATSPSSPLERAVADRFVGYCRVLDQGHSHRYYVDPPPTP